MNAPQQAPVIWASGQPCATPAPPRTTAGQTPPPYPQAQPQPVGPAEPITALLAYIGHVRARELVELRALLNRPSRGGWGVVFDPNRACWIGVRGRRTTVCAGSAEELHARIISGSWIT